MGELANYIFTNWRIVFSRFSPARRTIDRHVEYKSKYTKIFLTGIRYILILLNIPVFSTCR